MEARSAPVVDMTQGSVIRHLLKFAWPVFIGCLCQRLYNFVDAYIVGKYLGDISLSAVSVAGIATYLYTSLAMGVTTGVGVVMAQYFGAGDERSVRDTFTSSAYVAIGVIALLMTIGLVTLNPLLRLLQTPEEIFAEARTYLAIIYIGGIATMLYNWIAAALRALGNSVMPLIFLIVASVLNIFLDLLLVAWIPMGVAGAAWATVLSQLVSGVACLIYARRVTPLMRTKWREWHFTPKFGKEVLKYGLPTALQMSIISISDLTLQAVVNTYGTVMVLAYGVCTRVEAVGFQLGEALSAAAATFTGQNIGANNLDRVRKGARITMLMNVVGYLVVSVFIYIFAEPIMRLFTDNMEAIGYGMEYMHIIAIFFVFLGVICTLQSLLRAAGDIPITIAMGVSEVITRIGFAFLFSLWFGYHGLWWVSPITWLISAGLGTWRYLSGRWIGKSVVKNQETPVNP